MFLNTMIKSVRTFTPDQTNVSLNTMIKFVRTFTLDQTTNKQFVRTFTPDQATNKQFVKTAILALAALMMTKVTLRTRMRQK